MLRSQRALRRKRDHSTRNTRGCEPPSPRRGIYPRLAMKNGCLADYIACSHRGLCGFTGAPERSKSPPGSIFITAPVWMSDPISANRQITCLDPRMLTPPPHSPCIDWSVSYLPAAALFRNLKANISGPNITLLSSIFYLFPSLHYVSPSFSFAITSRNHPSTQRGNNRSSLSLGRSDCCTFHYDRDMSDCLEDGS